MKQNRTQPPRVGTYMMAGVLAGLILCTGWEETWRRWEITPQQRSLSILYVRTSLPHPLGDVKRSAYLQAVGLPVNKHDNFKLNGAGLHHRLKTMVFDGDSVLQFFMPLIIGIAVIVVACMILAMTGWQIQLKKIRNWQRMRGPQDMTIREFNKSVKGDYMPIEVREFKAK